MTLRLLPRVHARMLGLSHLSHFERMIILLRSLLKLRNDWITVNVPHLEVSKSIHIRVFP